MEEYMKRKLTEKQLKMSAKIMMSIAEATGDDEEEIEEFRKELSGQLDNAIYNIVGMKEYLLGIRDTEKYKDV